MFYETETEGKRILRRSGDELISKRGDLTKISPKLCGLKTLKTHVLYFSTNSFCAVFLKPNISLRLYATPVEKPKRPKKNSILVGGSTGLFFDLAKFYKWISLSL